MSMDDEDADLIAAKLASIQEAQEAGIPVLEDIDEALAKSLAEQMDEEFTTEQDALATDIDGVPNAPPMPKSFVAKKKAAAAAKAAVVPAAWKNFTYVEFAFAASDVQQGVVVAIDYNGYAEGAPMQRVGDKYYQTIALGCGKTYNYKVRTGSHLFFFIFGLFTPFSPTFSSHSPLRFSYTLPIYSCTLVAHFFFWLAFLLCPSNWLTLTFLFSFLFCFLFSSSFFLFSCPSVPRRWKGRSRCRSPPR